MPKGRENPPFKPEARAKSSQNGQVIFGQLNPMVSRPQVLGLRRVVILAIALAGLAAAWHLNLRPHELIPSEGGLTVMRRFFSGAVSPAVSYEAQFVPQGTQPLLAKAVRAAATTAMFAAAATSIALVFGLLLGFLGSTAWWADDPSGGYSRSQRVRRKTLGPAIYLTTRLLLTLSRSIHELLWAVLFLSAVGLTHLSAVIAIAIPYAGTFAKVFSEIIDETPRDAGSALRAAGSSRLQVFLFGLVPRAMPDLWAYTFYRFECALRSSAVLGFFGIPTLGYYIHLSFDNTHYREVWTYLYALIILVVIVDFWSGALRKRLVV